MRFLRSSTTVARYDLGGTLAQAVPAVSVPYINVTKAGPLQLADIDEKFRLESEDKLAKALKSHDDLWNDRTKSLSILPAYKEALNSQRSALQQKLYQRIRDNPAYFHSQANLLQVGEELRNIVDSPDIEAYKRNTEAVESNFKVAQDKGLLDNPYRDEQGQLHRNADGSFSGVTNRQYYDMVRGETGDAVRGFLGLGGNRPAGSIKANTWTGTDKDLEDEVDGLSGLAHASSWEKGQGGFSLAKGTAAAFGSKYDALLKTVSKAGGSTNKTALDAIVSAFGKDNWKQMLSKPAVQALTDKMYGNFQNTNFADVFKNTKLIEKNGAPISTAGTMAQVAAAARQGALQNSKEILKLIDGNRDKVVDKMAQHYIQSRVGARGYSESQQDYSTSIDPQGVGSADKGASDDDTAKYDTIIRDNMGNAVAQQVPGVDGKSTYGMYTIAPNTETVLNIRKPYYEPKEAALSLYAASRAGGMPVYLPAAPGQNLYQSFGGAASSFMKEAKVNEYLADVKVPSVTSPQVRQLETQLQQKRQQLEQSQTSKAYQGLGSKDATPQLQAEVQQLQQQLNQTVDSEKTRVRHLVNVVMTKQAFLNMSDKFQAQNREGQTVGPASPGWLFGKNMNVDLDSPGQDGASNIHNVKSFDPQGKDAAARARLKFSPDEKLVQFNIMLEPGAQEVLNDGGKGGRGRIGKLTADEARGEVNRNVTQSLGLSQP